MVCFLHLKKFVLYASLSLLGLLFGSSLINANNSAFALEDLTYTIDSSSNFDFYLCAEFLNVSCSGYKYLLVQTNFDVNVFSSFSSFSFHIDSYNSSIRVPFNFPFSLYYVEGFTRIRHLSISGSSSFPSDWSVSFTLSENNPYGSLPSGSLEITENGTYDVSQYAEAVVNVPTESAPVTPDGSCDYTASLEAIRRAILTCGAILLLIYFFYCIYRIIIKSTGGN